MENEVGKYSYEGENNIEFTQNSKTATVYFAQGRYISKIKKLKEKYPDEVDIAVENYDGSIVAHIPTKWIKISASKREMTDEQREAARKRLTKYLKSQGKKVKSGKGKRS